MLPEDFPLWQTVYAYFTQWSEPGLDGLSVLEQALKKSGWRGPQETGAQRLRHALDWPMVAMAMPVSLLCGLL